MSAAAVPVHAVLRSEWTKLRSLPSTWWSAAVYALLTGGGGWLAAATTATADGAGSAVTLALIGSGFAQYAVLALGVIAGAVEFSTGMVLVSLAAVPRRVRWLAARTVVLAVAVAVLAGVLALVFALRSRLFSRRAQVLAMLVVPLAVAVGAGIGLPRHDGLDPTRPAVAVVVVLLGLVAVLGWGRLGEVAAARTSRWLDRLETLAVVALVPLAVVLWGGLDWVRSLT